MSDQVELLKEAVHTFLPSYLPSYRRDISFLECFTHFPKIILFNLGTEINNVTTWKTERERERERERIHLNNFG